MPSFRQIAEPLAKMGVPITPVRPGTKRAFLPDFPTTATTDLQQIYAWDKLYSDHNAACVARVEDGGVWFFEVDSADVIPRLERETGQKMPQTFRVRSRPGRGHFYFRHNAASMQLGNISQTYVIGQDWSVRTNREYVVGPGSLHPDTGQPYQALDWTMPIAEAPNWLVEWLLSQKIQKQTTTQKVEAPRNERGMVPHGSIHGYMLSEAGRMRHIGLTQEEIEVALLRKVHENCEAPIDEDKVIQMASSVCRSWAPGTNRDILPSQPQQPIIPPDAEPEEELVYKTIEYPIFPRHVMFGTSLYDGFVKLYCGVSSRIDYFMWVPAAALMLNYLGTKVGVELAGWSMPSLYLILIGQKGRANKSSSIKDAMKYLEFAGMLQMYSKSTKAAEGRTLVWEAGSPEGLGTDMQRTNCKNAVLFYDELSALVSKARIDGSGMNSALLKMYESSNFGNSIKTKKDTFEIKPDSYCTTLITATTDKKFTELWSGLAGEDTGLNDRFTWVLQPKSLPELKLPKSINYALAAAETKKLVDRAVTKKTYSFFDTTPLQRIMEVYGTRTEIRAEKWALYFAIDMGLDEIDEDCVARGIEMVKYEEAVKDYLMTFEAKNDESRIQQGVIRLLKKNEGTMVKREVERTLSANTYGLSIWNRAYGMLLTNGYVVEEGMGVKGDPRKIRLIRDMTFGDKDD